MQHYLTGLPNAFEPAGLEPGQSVPCCMLEEKKAIMRRGEYIVLYAWCTPSQYERLLRCKNNNRKIDAKMYSGGYIAS